MTLTIIGPLTNFGLFFLVCFIFVFHHTLMEQSIGSVKFSVHMFCCINNNILSFFCQSDDAEEQAARRKEEEAFEKFKNLFSECKFFLSREVPREALVFVIRYFIDLWVKSQVQDVFCTPLEEERNK